MVCVCVWIVKMPAVLSSLLGSMDEGSSSECDEETTPIANRAHPFGREDEATHRRGHSGHRRRRHQDQQPHPRQPHQDGGRTATPLEELKFVIEALPSSNALHGQSHTMNRAIMALQMDGLLPPADAATWAKVPRPTEGRGVKRRRGAFCRERRMQRGPRCSRASPRSRSPR